MSARTASKKRTAGGGVLLAGVPGVSAASVVILGGGVAGTNAALIASGMGADVAVLDRNPEALRRIAAQLGAACARCSPPATWWSCCAAAPIW